jgi:hypothetical protein
VVDVWSAFTASTYLPDSMYTVDGVHPNPAGAALVAHEWYNALIAQGFPDSLMSEGDLDESGNLSPRRRLRRRASRSVSVCR